MEPQDRRTLLKLVELVEENNKILRKIQRSNRVGTAFRIFYWLIIIGVSVGAFYYLEPYIQVAKTAYQSIQSDINNLEHLRASIIKK